ncbi:hypothetical protein [uncultured Aquimarina sp.]|uniref:hypothetical protein n=1 Tax=uncultured Aquimarina sp. TaxID=575652 RepID=UPI00262BD904|nr:hypothetical protein [uncultured Aquimarina sp.]
MKRFLNVSLVCIMTLLFFSCGSDDGEADDDNNSEGCELRLNTGLACDYSEFQNITFTKGAYIDGGPSEFTGTDGVTHFFRKIILADGDISLDQFGNIVSDNATAYVEFFLYSLGTDEFKLGTFEPWASIDPKTSSFISLAGDLSYECSIDTNGLACDSRIGMGDAIVVISENGTQEVICFDFLLSFFGSGPKCVKGTFSGELKDLTPN